MKRFAYILVASCYLLMAYGGAFDPSAGIGIFDGSNDVGPTLYPPQPNLGAWYYSTDATNALARVGANATYMGNNCLSFDGVGDKAEFGNIGNIVNSVATDFSLEFTVNLDAALQYDCLFGKFTTSVYGWMIDIPDVGVTTLLFNVHDGSTTKQVGIVKASGWATYKIERVGDQYTWYIDGVAQSSTTDTLSGQAHTINTSAGTNFRLGSRNDSPYGAMTISYMKLVEDGSTTCEAHFCEGARYVIYDVSGNGNHGMITSNSGITTQWITDTEARAWNIADGFTPALYGNGTDDYFDTGLALQAGLKVRVTLYYDYAGGTQTAFGGGATGSSDSFFMAGRGYYGNTVGGVSIEQMFGTFEMEGNSQYCYVRNNGVLIETIDNGSTPSFNNDLLVFARDGFGSPVNFSTDAITRLEVWHYTGTKLRDYQAQVDGTFYESVYDTVVSSAGAGDFQVVYVPALSDGSADALGDTIQNPGGYFHNGAESSIVFPAGLLGAGAVTNTGAEFLAWGPTTNFPIRNAFVYTNTISNTNLLELYCEIFDGIYTNATP